MNANAQMRPAVFIPVSSLPSQPVTSWTITLLLPEDYGGQEIAVREMREEGGSGAPQDDGPECFTALAPACWTRPVSRQDL